MPIRIAAILVFSLQFAGAKPAADTHYEFSLEQCPKEQRVAIVAEIKKIKPVDQVAITDAAVLRIRTKDRGLLPENAVKAVVKKHGACVKAVRRPKWGRVDVCVMRVSGGG